MWQALVFAACPENCSNKCCTSTFGLPTCELSCQASCAAANLACGKPAPPPDLLTPKVPLAPITLPSVAPPPVALPPVAPVAPVVPVVPFVPVPVPVPVNPVPVPVITPPARVAPSAVAPPPRVTAPARVTPQPVDVAAKPGKQSVCSVSGSNQTVTVTKRGTSCEAVYHKGEGRSETIWRSGYSPESCTDKATEFVKRLGGRGLVCNTP